jgi:hypothetical protein
MTSLTLIGAAALSLALAAPAVAAQHVKHHHVSTVRHARDSDYRSFYGAYGFDRGSGISDDFDRRNTFN